MRSGALSCKQKHVTKKMAEERIVGDAWVWVAIDADTKLVPCWLPGTRVSVQQDFGVQRVTASRRFWCFDNARKFLVLTAFSSRVRQYNQNPSRRRRI